MIKKISTLALAGLVAWPALAAADTDRIAELEGQMQAMQAEITELKQQDESGKGGLSSDQLSMGGEVIFRGYRIRNVWTFDDDNKGDDRDAFRLKGSLWANYQATDDVSVRIQFTNQSWGETDDAGDNVDNKVFLDNAYIQANNLFGLPVDATLGRQNLIYGSGFVILDGQSQYGSTSIYFDGIKLRFHLTDLVSLDAIYMKDRENTPGHSVRDDITLAGFYLINQECPLTGMRQELYALNRKDETLDKDIWMYGARFSDRLQNGLDYSLEGAIQRGDATKDVDQKAYGMKLDAGYTLQNTAFTPRFYANYSYLSGNKRGTDDNEQWDVFYGGWPQWGDLLAWKYLNVPPNNLNQAYSSFGDYSGVTGEAIYSNLQIITVGASAQLTPKLSANLSYSDLSFNRTDPGVDKDFGDYYQATFRYQYTPQLSFGLYAAMLEPGDAFEDNDDSATEVFWEVAYRF
ncbi:alginate export family protein [Desulfurivibrio alkaliphilus]|uniref:Alginate export domain-containing protein n=1 Tax=Desulfurivibrio alkaliphilus (strain DSM 19089 / UNIQEM U267 / AHT2) TaxID=589865 RepID=D6Z5U1_DESAT|nr:alginate export family protein [Desulfurivibrio alkaliphilus]ADH84823.1 hypothetical protein DaAHT2_0110 [Desulfurivibrio alkaliphilus AHT 2]